MLWRLFTWILLTTGSFAVALLGAMGTASGAPVVVKIQADASEKSDGRQFIYAGSRFWLYAKRAGAGRWSLMGSFVNQSSPTSTATLDLPAGQYQFNILRENKWGGEYAQAHNMMTFAPSCYWSVDVRPNMVNQVRLPGSDCACEQRSNCYGEPYWEKYGIESASAVPGQGFMQVVNFWNLSIGFCEAQRKMLARAYRELVLGAPGKGVAVISFGDRSNIFAGHRVRNEDAYVREWNAGQIRLLKSYFMYSCGDDLPKQGPEASYYTPGQTMTREEKALAAQIVEKQRFEQEEVAKYLDNIADYLDDAGRR